MTVDIYVVPGKRATSGISGEGALRLRAYLNSIEEKIRENGLILVPSSLNIDSEIERIVGNHLSSRTGTTVVERLELNRVQPSYQYFNELLTKALALAGSHGANAVEIDDLRNHGRALSYSPRAEPYVKNVAMVLKHSEERYKMCLVIPHRSTAEGLVMEYAQLGKSHIPMQLRVGKRRVQRKMELIVEEYGLPLDLVRDILAIERNALFLPQGAAVRFENDGRIKLIGPYQKKFPDFFSIGESELAYFLHRKK